MKKIIVFLIIITLLGALIYTFLLKNGKNTENLKRFSGTVEITDVNISFKVSGRLKCILFEEGEKIEKGDMVAELDDKDELISLSAAKANLEYKKVTLDAVLAGSRVQEIKSARASVYMALAAQKRAVADVNQAKNDRDRYKKLFDSKGVSQRDYEVYETAYIKALSAEKEAFESVQRAKENLSLVVEGSRSEDIKKAEAVVVIAEEEVKKAEAALEYTKIYSPINGKVLTKPAEVGEFVQPGGVIITAGDIQNAWVRGYISQKILGKIKIGQKVKIYSDSYPEKVYEGVVSYIGEEAEFTPKSVETDEERVKLMFRIKVTVDNKDEELKPGMPVVGEIITE